MFVYVIENTVNGKRYVGKSTQPAKRWTQHRINARNGVDSILYRAIRKHGEESFEFSVVEECESEAASFEAECRWIAKLQTHGEGGYNATPGGEGIIVTDELRAKWSERRKGKPARPEVVAKRAASNRGKKRSDETRKRLSDSAKLRPAGSFARGESLSIAHAAQKHPTATLEAVVSLLAEGMTYQKIATQLGCSVALVQKRLSEHSRRARQESHTLN